MSIFMLRLISFFTIAPNAGPVELMDIFGFSTEELFRAMTIKARKSTGHFQVDGEIPGLLEQLHKEMANDVHCVR